MPDYLDFDTSLSDLTPEDAAKILSVQEAKIKAVLEHLNSPDPVQNELMESVVSV